MIERKDGESQFDFHKRLIYGKLVDKTLADIDYAELSQQVYGTDWSSEAVRKAMYGSLKTLQLMDEQKVTLSPLANTQELDMRLVELQKERQRFFDQRREFNKIVNEDARYQHILERLADAAQRLANEHKPATRPALDIDVNNEQHAVLVLNDWHYGMVANNMMNEYDTFIAEERVRQVVDQAILRIKEHRPVILHVILLGDMAHGAIHPSCRVASSETVADQLMQVCEIIAEQVERLENYVPNVIVSSTYGNHMRTVQKKQDNLHRDNMERLIPWWLEQRLSLNENVYVRYESDDEFIYLEVADTHIVASHGDLDGVSTSPRLLPAMFMKKYGTGVDVIVLGDKHHAEEFEELGVTAMVADALCGADELNLV